MRPIQNGVRPTRDRLTVLETRLDMLEDQLDDLSTIGQRLQDSAAADRAMVAQVVSDVATQLPSLRADVTRPWVDLAAFGRLPRGSQLLVAGVAALCLLGWLLHLWR